MGKLPQSFSECPSGHVYAVMASLDPVSLVLSDPLDLPAREAKALLSANVLAQGSAPEVVCVGPDSVHPLGRTWGEVAEWKFRPDDSPFDDSTVALAWSPVFDARWALMRSKPRHFTPTCLALESLRRRPVVVNLPERSLENRDLWDCVFGRATLQIYVAVESALRRFADEWFALERLAAVRVWCLLAAHLGWPTARLDDVYTSVLWSQYNTSEESGSLERPENGTSGGKCRRELVRAKHELSRAEAFMTMEEMGSLSMSRCWGEKPWEFDWDWVRLSQSNASTQEDNALDSWEAPASEAVETTSTVWGAEALMSMATPQEEYDSWFQSSSGAWGPEQFVHRTANPENGTTEAFVTVGRKPRKKKKLQR